MGAEVVDLAKLRELSWNGVPEKHRYVCGFCGGGRFGLLCWVWFW